MSEPYTSDPPHIVAANSDGHVAALSMAPLPKGASSHADAAVKLQAEAAKNQNAANNMKSGGSRKGKKKRRTGVRKSRKGRAKTPKNKSRKVKRKRSTRDTRRRRKSRGKRSNKK